ncbi:hypothetical protein I3843_14G042000 [Carya illinoinensis]|uniref:BHLH domain-containing protein n=1 Tax=Carya illinoinensis TaxID=32201 RepID=A0A8T1NGC9_CARIL|nr:transcription factor bHLH62 [Carya illinoinensis]KAG2669663.1 hypothetical protein I3760_14G042500 [Carya illinoinensis]KAG6628851.1 hypothetical protein CIPAW_14G041100 [Carya illinoinensis]KAG6677779.1 hypothetical protein I3842_14G043500 [Carya illinoinensis]KAG7946494.1 hypothetical protein I3843_14G042000 [Carya illinoinensis]
MENEFFQNAGMHFESSASMPTIWHSLSSAMESRGTELNCMSDQSPDCPRNPSWEKSIDHGIHFDSALSSIVSSPAASNTNLSHESFVIRELIGKLGNIGNSGDISPHSRPLLAAYIGGNNSANTSCYSTPLNSPPKPNVPRMDHLIKENLPSLGKSMPLSSSVAEFSADPGFAERAAKFSRFASRSFNDRTSQFGLNNAEALYRSNLLVETESLSRVSSSASLKAVGSQMRGQENYSSPLQDRTELANSQEESTISEQIPDEETGLKASNVLNPRKRKSASKGKEKEPKSSPFANSTKVAEANGNSNAKRCKPNEANGKENGPVKAEEEAKGSTSSSGDEKQSKTNAKPPEPPKDYIHVRARRGQATDSHSLAERVRREKISERMKFLQDLVPGCNKVTGKALMLDEIINYVQSLQRQVEFLSMKLSSVNTRLDLNMDTLISKDIFQSNNPLPHAIFRLDSRASAFYAHQAQQDPALHSNISNGTATQCSVDPLDTAPCQSLSVQLPPLNGYRESVSQFPMFGEDDLQTIVQMGFGQNPSQETAVQPQSFHG